MKRFALGGTLAVLLALSLAFAACGGDDDSGGTDTPHGNTTSNIRTQQGLAVAALFSESSNGLNAGGGVSDGIAAPGADRSSSGTEDSGVVAPAPAQQTTDGAGITASGYGSATADADSAAIDLYFYSYGAPTPIDIVPPVEPDGSNGSDSGGSIGSTSAPTKPGTDTGTVTQITESVLQPVIDALEAAGCCRAESS